ncbi:MAG: alanine racemase [Gammaproteobacteria bacterium]
MKRAAYALINLSHLKHNLSIVKKIAHHSKVMAVVKADAYGHGVLSVCKSLSQTDAFSVACINEAVELRENGVTKPILSLQGFSTEKELQFAIAHNIEIVLHHPDQLKQLQSYTSIVHPLDVYVKIDTGMHRLGFEPSQFDAVITQLKSLLPNESKISVMTHLACADEINNPATEQQLELFDHTLNGQEFIQSIANSAGILAWPKSHRDWVRPGLMLYGVNPLDADVDKLNVELKPVMSFRAPVISIKQCLQGDRIGYGGDYCCPHDMVIAVVAAGYADGYPRHIPGAPMISIHNKSVPIVGRVSMDMITADITGIESQVGDEVELWGNDISVEKIARDADTISYELLCAAGNAVPKKFIE